MHSIKDSLGAGEIKIIVKKVMVEGRGVILLTGPSSCGKGEVAKALCRFLSLPEAMHLSMGDILRRTVDRSKIDKYYCNQLADRYGISDKISIFDDKYNKYDIVEKAKEHEELLRAAKSLNTGFISQFDWLEFCVSNGLLVPDEWTVNILDAMLYNSPELHNSIFILDGYPRTVIAAELLLNTLEKLDIPVIKVIHLSITKEQMKIRAKNRNRKDDTEESLNRRYTFYIEKVQPCVDYMKLKLGISAVSLIDAHQPIFTEDGSLDIDASINGVVRSVVQSLGLPGFLLDI